METGPRFKVSSKRLAYLNIGGLIHINKRSYVYSTDGLGIERTSAFIPTSDQNMSKEQVNIYQKVHFREFQG